MRVWSAALVNTMNSRYGAEDAPPSYEKYVKNLKWYHSSLPNKDLALCSFIEDLHTCKVSELDNGVQLISLTSGAVFPGVVVKSSARFLYSRHFYPALLKRIRSWGRAVLVSNPGTGKSMFQWYYLARLLNPEAFSDALPCDSEGRTDPREVVIRQVGVSHMEIFFLRARVAHTVSSASHFFCVLRSLPRLYISLSRQGLTQNLRMVLLEWARAS